MSEPEPMICRPGGSGTFFPLLEIEQEWPDRVRAMIYAALLIYVFLGVSIVADMFMESITAITSERRRVRNKKTGHFVTVMRWNPTVSNLTLMALGSSAPEILLSIMEMLNKDFYSGELGPSTIVGSAAFNLFCIIGVCIMSVPSPETRAIKAYNVFVITALFSIFAYLWLVFVVQVNSKDIIEPWEGFATLLFFPVLIVISYLADIGWLDKGPGLSELSIRKAKMDVEAPEEKSVHASKPICDLQGRVIRNATGVFSFSEETFQFSPESDRETPISVDVLRCNGTRGLVTCNFKTERLTAVPGYDYLETHGVLRFEEGDTSKAITIQLKPKKLWKRTDEFQIVLSDATGGVLFNPNDDGGEEACVATVSIIHRNDVEVLRRQSDKMKHSLDYCCNMRSVERAFHDWLEQITNACCNISDDGDDDEDANSDDDHLIDKRETWSGFRVFMHLVSLPWKLLFAVVIPPVELSGGWVCFIVSLACIGTVTSLIIDLAELFGCVVGIEDSVVAITFVALGTSMPDLFASWKEAVESPDADASIVNVTGSNSVNVFLGIGIPWTMAALYWAVVDPTPKWLGLYPSFTSKYPNGAFVVLGGNLAFSVGVFTLSAVIACFVLWLRRKCLGGELGGPAGTKVLSGFLFCMLWIFYIFLSIWKTSNPDASVDQQVLAIGLSLSVLQNVVLFAGGGLALFLSWLWRKPEDNGECLDSERRVLVPALKQRHMVMEDLAGVLEQVECPQELRDAVLDTDLFVQKLATVEGTTTLNSAAMAFAIAQLRPNLEHVVYRLHGLAWVDFLSVLRKVGELHVLRQAAAEPKEFLNDLEMGTPLEAAKEFFIAKLIMVLRPSLKKNHLSDEDVRAVGEHMVSADCFDRIKAAIEQPESVVQMLSASGGGLGSGSSKDQMGKICAIVNRKSLLQPAFEQKGLPWTHVMPTVRKMCCRDGDINTIVEGLLLSKEGPGPTETEGFVTMTCNFAKEDTISALKDEFESIMSTKNLTPYDVDSLFRALQLEDLMSAIEDLQSGKGSPEAIWAKLMRASHEANRQLFVAQIKYHFEALPDGREKWIEVLPWLHQRPLAELQRVAEDKNYDSFLPRLLGRSSANEQEIDSMGDPFLSSTNSRSLNGSRNLPWNSSRKSTRGKEAALEADLFKVVQGPYAFRGDLLNAAQGSRGGVPALDDGEVQAAALLDSSGSHEHIEHINGRSIGDQPMQSNRIEMLDDAGQQRNPRNTNRRKESIGMLEDEGSSCSNKPSTCTEPEKLVSVGGVEDLKNTWGKEADRFLADRKQIDPDDLRRAQVPKRRQHDRRTEGGRGRQCPGCTFLNMGDQSVCEMCNTSLLGNETYNSEPGAKPYGHMGVANGMRDGSHTISETPPRKSGDKKKSQKSSRPNLNGPTGR